MAPALKLPALRQQAKKLGMASKALRTAGREDLENYIAENSDNGGTTKGKAKAKTAVKKAVAAKKSAKKSAPAKKSRTSGKAKRQTAQKASTSSYEAKGGRNTLDGVNFSETDGWNPRPGSAPDVIVKALRKFKGNRTKVYEHLLPNIGDFVKAKKSDGSAWEKGDGPGSRKGMLKYRIARTAWQFAIQTGQHEKSDNRVTYGTGGTGAGIFKRQKATRTRSTTSTATKASKKASTKGRKSKGTTRRRAARK